MISHKSFATPIVYYKILQLIGYGLSSINKNLILNTQLNINLMCYHGHETS